MVKQDQIFDTRVDTKKLFVSMKTKFVKREYVDKNGKSLIYLVASSGKTRERINIDLLIDSDKWNPNKQRLNVITPHDSDINLILDNIESKITNIRTVYRLSEIVLTPPLLRKELTAGLTRVNFVSYMEQKLNENKSFLNKGSYNRYCSVLKKIKDWKSEIFFNEIDHSFIEKYKQHLRSLGNRHTTINANLKAVKTYLRYAKKDGITIKINIDDIVAGTTTGNRTSLTPAELKIYIKQYFHGSNTPTRKLALGYFLFSCFTGMRISDVMNLERSQLEKEVHFTSVKTKRDQIISLNNKAIEIIKECEDLFVEKPTEQYINRTLKEFTKFLGIRKNVSFHVARHTFATNFLRMGGKVEKLQLLLGHSNINTTMVYVHILQEEANQEIFLLDNLFA